MTIPLRVPRRSRRWDKVGNGTSRRFSHHLDAALSDKDPSVRGAAFQALASRGGPEAMGSLWQALKDPDPGVRILAVESVALGKEGEALLEEALSDADETVRVKRLKQVSN